MTLKILHVHVDETDDALRTVLRAATKDVVATQEPCQLLIGGYDDNPAPLWGLESACEFAKRLVGLGFLSPLKTMVDPTQRDMKRGWTAYELWLCARNELGPDIDIQRMLRDCRKDSQFMLDLSESNKKCDELLKE